MKHGLDRLVAAILLLVLAPILLLIALMIKVGDGGSIFFVHERPGFAEKKFRMWKFRTMIPDADRYLDHRGHVKNVTRVTPFGRVLRSLSLDEFPQLFNIVKGEMSFVGPRPGTMEHFLRYTDEQRGRVRMRPGITGLAQVSGRNTLAWSRRIELDLEYVRNYSLWLDLKILAKTVKVVFLREGIVLDRNPEQVDDLQPPKDEKRA